MVVMQTRLTGSMRVGAQVLDVVQLGELAAVVRGGVLLELVEGLPRQVGPVHQEQHAPDAAELDQPVDLRDGGEGLAAAGRHLDQRAGPVLGQGLAPGSGSRLICAGRIPSVTSGGRRRRRRWSVEGAPYSAGVSCTAE